MKSTAKVFLLAVIAVLFNALALGQVPTGTPPFGSFGGGPFDVVNLGNLNAHFSIAVRHKAGRGLPFAYDIGYDTSVWYPVTTGGTTTWTPVNAYGWTLPAGPSGFLTSTIVQTAQIPCSPPNDMHLITQIVYAFYVYHEPNGATHPINNSFVWYSDDSCNQAQPSGGTATAADGSGYVLTLASWTGAATVTGADGRVYLSPNYTLPTLTDNNGNQITVDNNGNYTDTLGTNALSVTGAFPKSFTYTPPKGTAVSWKLDYTSYTVQTNFGCSGIAEYNASGVELPADLTLPDGTKYLFTYEQTQGKGSGYTTGRLASVTLPTGGSITYTYPLTNSGTTNGINCADGSAPIAVNGNPSMTRTVSPGGTWNYYRTQVSGNHWQTKITSPPDPTVGDDTVIDFQQDASTVQYANTHNFFEVQRKTYQGSSGSGTLLTTNITCYNTANPTAANCPTTSVSTLISRVTAFSYLPDTSSSSKWSETDTQYNYISDPAFPSEVDSYDYGTGAVGPLIRKVMNSWSIIGNKVVPTGVGVYDSSMNLKASTGYTYDGSALATPTGTTPQWTTTGIGGNRGNLTRVSQQVSGTVTLYRDFTYYNNGVLNTASDWGTTTSGGPNTVTYNLPDATSTCGNAFPKSVSEPLSLSRSFTYDCNGGVPTSVTDENSQTTTTYYSQTSSYGSPDANYWRPYATTDQLNNPTTLSYPSNIASESALLFNSGNSVVDQRITTDDFGRPILSQTKEGPSSSTYDSTQTDYDVWGRPIKKYIPFANTAGATCSGTCPGTTQSYDALSRPLTATDGGSGALAYTYTKNDTLQVAGPAPTGENIKQKQFEYDGLGRLSSVCEITSATGSGTCGQTTSPTGFWTKYTYDVLGDMTGVTQNAQAASGSQQTRTYTFDMAGRMLTEQNPETGSSAITYTYDSADSNCGSYASPGDLVEKKDAMGNYTCMKYDALHRVSQITYPAGTYASPTTPMKCFIYDSATVNSTGMANAKTRLAEAYTTSSSVCNGTNVTVDEGFSYTARGEVSDVYEKTPDSGGYYHVNATYWAHGRLNVLNGGTSPLPGLPVITYGASNGTGLDSKGRITQVTAGSGQNPASSISWNIGNQVTGVTFGSGDGDSYQYDPSTGRMTQYKLNEGTSSITGALTWNANATLQKLQITDTINSADTQTCTNAYDDLMRLVSNNCGSVWSQTFSFDPFGNLSKSGSATFSPTYTGASGAGAPTNQYYQIPSGGTGTSTYYDSNGNLKYDVGHTYTWDADGNMLSVDGTTVTMIYDAMDRMVEQTRSSGHTEIVYGPYAMKLALMNGQSLVSAFVKIPGGGNAVYSSTGLTYYRHADHLSSSRLATKTTKGLRWYQTAYAPYGEDYAQAGDHPDLAFTDENQDTVAGGWSTNLYDFMLREYRPAQGRWTSPDPSGLGAVDPTNPQTWNRYSYVLNDPTTLVDLLGDTCYDGAWANSMGPALCEAMGGNYGWYDTYMFGITTSNGSTNVYGVGWDGSQYYYYGPNGGTLDNQQATELGLPPLAVAQNSAWINNNGVAIPLQQGYCPPNQPCTGIGSSSSSGSTIKAQPQPKPLGYLGQINCQNAVMIAKLSDQQDMFEGIGVLMGAGMVGNAKAGWTGVVLFASALFADVHDARTACGAPW